MGERSIAFALKDCCRKGPTGRCSPWEVSSAVPWCFFALSVEDGYSSTSLQNQALLGSGCCNLSLTTGSNSTSARGSKVALAWPCPLGQTGLGEGRDQRVACGLVAQHAVNEARAGFQPNVFLGTYFIVYFACFICWEQVNFYLLGAQRNCTNMFRKRLPPLETMF